MKTGDYQIVRYVLEIFINQLRLCQISFSQKILMWGGGGEGQKTINIELFKHVFCTCIVNIYETSGTPNAI